MITEYSIVRYAFIAIDHGNPVQIYFFEFDECVFLYYDITTARYIKWNETKNHGGTRLVTWDKLNRCSEWHEKTAKNWNADSLWNIIFPFSLMMYEHSSSDNH